MIKSILSSLVQALENIRSNLFHTFLSILGIVIGVAALVTILSLIDGMEKFANEQIANTTDLNMMMVQTDAFQEVNGVNIEKDTFPILQYDQLSSLQTVLGEKAQAVLVHQITSAIKVSGKTESFGAFLMGIAPKLPEMPNVAIAHGRMFTPEEVEKKAMVAVLSDTLAKALAAGQPLEALLGKTINTKEYELNIIGILEESKQYRAQVILPFTLLSQAALKETPPRLLIHVNFVSDIPALKDATQDWLKAHFAAQADDFEIKSNEFRVKQAGQAFLLFRVVMSLIVGISILVGGIGVMNVLLISVTERTSEIGIRKAMGANKSDILRLFLSESITISLFGSMLGLVIGWLVSLAAVPIIRAFVDVPFQAAYTWNTFLIITIIAILIGVIFGTYPAMKAARLDPVEAIRRE